MFDIIDARCNHGVFKFHNFGEICKIILTFGKTLTIIKSTGTHFYSLLECQSLNTYCSEKCRIEAVAKT